MPGRLKGLEVTFFTNCSNSDCPDPHHSFSSTCFQLPSNLFDGLQNLQRLILRNLTTSLPSAIFDDLFNLWELKLFDLMTSLPSGIFDNLFNLSKLTVKGGLSTIDQGALANLQELTYLDIGGNQLERPAKKKSPQPQRGLAPTTVST